MEKAARLPGRALAVGLFLWQQVGMKNTSTVTLPLARLASMGVTKSAAGRGLRQLERAGLVTIDRQPRHAASVTILDARCDQ